MALPNKGLWEASPTPILRCIITHVVHEGASRSETPPTKIFGQSRPRCLAPVSR